MSRPSLKADLPASAKEEMSNQNQLSVPTVLPGASGQRLQPLSRRAFLKLAGSIAATATIAGCIPQAAASDARRGGKVQLVYQDCRCLGEQYLLEEFHESHPNIEVFYIPEADDYEETMLAEMQSGVAPDVLSGCCDTLPIWAQKGYLLDMRPFVDADLDHDTIADWDGAQYKSFFTNKGVQFALPKYHGALALYYNKDMLDRYKISYPDGSWTHDDYLKAMLQLKSALDAEGRVGVWGSMIDISWDRLQVHVNGFGGHFVDPENATRSWMAKPEALKAMEWIRARMWDEHVMATKLDVENAQTRDAFIRQSLAMVEDGSWALKDILDQAHFRLGVAPFPAGPVKRVTLATTDGFSIFAGTKQPEAALGANEIPGWA